MPQASAKGGTEGTARDRLQRRFRFPAIQVRLDHEAVCLPPLRRPPLFRECAVPELRQPRPLRSRRQRIRPVGRRCDLPAPTPPNAAATGRPSRAAASAAPARSTRPFPTCRSQATASAGSGSRRPRSAPSIRCSPSACRSARRPNPGDEMGIAFDFLADPLVGGAPTGEHVLTGHDNGLITLNVAEADSAEREKMRAEMGENYRTLLGHFRHELGHYYWDRLIRDDPGRLERFHALFGDESADYDAGAAPPLCARRAARLGDAPHLGLCGEPPLGGLGRDLRPLSPHHRHAGDGARAEHPAGAAGDRRRRRTARQRQGPAADGPASGRRRQSGAEPFDRTLARWLVLSEASNSINRCMGLPDLYPFVISPVAAREARLRPRIDLAGRRFPVTESQRRRAPAETVCNKTSDARSCLAGTDRFAPRFRPEGP